MPHIHKDFLAITLFFLLISINQAYLIPHEVVAYGTSGTYPTLLNGMMAFFTACYLFEALRKRRLKTDQSSKIPLNFRGLYKPAGLLLCIWVWVDGCESIGFMLSSMALLVASCLLYGERSPTKIIVLAVTMPLVLLLFFSSLRSVLPEGPVDTWILSILRG